MVISRGIREADGSRHVCCSVCLSVVVSMSRLMIVGWLLITWVFKVLVLLYLIPVSIYSSAVFNELSLITSRVSEYPDTPHTDDVSQWTASRNHLPHQVSSPIEGGVQVAPSLTP